MTWELQGFEWLGAEKNCNFVLKFGPEHTYDLRGLRGDVARMEQLLDSKLSRVTNYVFVQAERAEQWHFDRGSRGRKSKYPASCRA